MRLDAKQLRELAEQQLKFPVSDVLYDQFKAEDLIALLDELQRMELCLETNGDAYEAWCAMGTAIGLRELLGDAIYLAEEGWSYASEYFQDKWDYHARIEVLRKAIGR